MRVGEKERERERSDGEGLTVGTRDEEMMYGMVIYHGTLPENTYGH